MGRLFEISKAEKRWLVTLSDLVTLLLTFFVLMLSMAQINLEKFKQTIDSLKKDRGSRSVNIVNADSVEADAKATIVETDADSADIILRQKEVTEGSISMTKNLKEDFQEIMDKLNKIIKENHLEADVEMETSNHGIRLRVKGKLLFDSGMANLRPGAKPFINGVADALKRNNFYLVVEGHTDSRPIKTEKYPSNWELSGARAAAVIRTLIDEGITKSRLSAIGYADNYPIEPNKTLSGRLQNRRVEFIFTQYPTRIVI